MKQSFSIAFLLSFAAWCYGATSVTSGEITWTFDADYPVGQYIDGEYYVVAPSGMTVTAISPSDPDTGDELVLHGSTINPVPDTSVPLSQGWTSLRPYPFEYAAGKNDALSLPLALSAGDCLTSTKTKTSVENSLLAIDDFRVLHVVSAAPAANSFRPPYAGTTRGDWGTVADLDFSMFQSLASVGYERSYSGVLSALGTGPQIEAMVPNYFNSRLKSASSYSGYGRQTTEAFTDAVLLMNMASTNSAQREALAIKIVQAGIDIYGALAEGGYFGSDGGHNGGRRLPVLIGAMMLDDSRLHGILDSATYPEIFQENGQHQFLDNSITTVQVNELQLDQMETWMNGTPEWFSNSNTDNKPQLKWDKSSYRWVNGQNNVGLRVAIELIDGVDEWDGDAFIEYMDYRFWPIEQWGIYTTSTTVYPWYKNLWNAYMPNPTRCYAVNITPKPSRTKKNAVTIELSCETPGVDIYYTLNKTEPTSSSTLYTGPIELTYSDASVYIAARAIDPSAILLDGYPLYERYDISRKAFKDPVPLPFLAK